MRTSSELEKIVYDFYRSVYSSSMSASSSFLSFRNEFFNHPVVTPNYYVSNFPTTDHFSSSFSWINCFKHDQRENALRKAGYDVQQQCQYLFYFKSRPLISSDASLELVSELSTNRQLEFDLKTVKNSPGLTTEILMKLKQVFEHSMGLQHSIAAINPTGDMVAGITILESRSATLLLNAWVEPEFRRRGYMKQLLANILDRSFSTGAHCVFAWTFNPSLFDQADEEATLMIYKPAPPSLLP